MGKKKWNKLRSKMFYTLLIIMVLFCGCSVETANQQMDNLKNDTDLKIHFLDVGQADCTIVQSGGETMLIDSGNNDDKEYILSYLKELGVEEIKYAVGTHSHEDHIGSMDSVMNAVSVQKILLPKEEVSSKTYQDVLDAIALQKVTVIRPVVGEEYKLGEAIFTILAPTQAKYSDTNDYSVSLLLTYKKNKFLFTGDASEKSEQEMLDIGVDLEADVFQAGHHGSRTANSQAFLDKVNPIYTVISCGTDNKYGHPHAEIMARFEESDIQVYRTDKQGTIIATSDGKEIHWEVGKSIALSDKAKDEDNKKKQEKDEILANTESKKEAESKKSTYILNIHSKKFHLSDCSGVKKINDENKKKVKDTKENLIEEGYEACKVCNP